MKIYDDKNNLLAVFIKKDDIKEVRNFETSNDEEFQIGSFNLEKNTIIESHIHLNQKRIISKTSEALVVIEGEMEVTIYDNERKFIDKLLVQDGDTILVPEKTNQVYVFGSISDAGSALYTKGQDFKYYIDKKGGLTSNADSKNIFVLHPNGETYKLKIKKNLFIY